jgi:hypothetical protein
LLAWSGITIAIGQTETGTVCYGIVTAIPIIIESTNWNSIIASSAIKSSPAAAQTSSLINRV